MDIEMMPHAMYFTGNPDTVTKINHIPYQTIVYNDNGMFTTKLMNDTPIKIFIDNRATPSILPLHTYNRFPILHMYPRTDSNTSIHTGGGLIKSHFWLEILLKLDYQTIQIKVLVCDSECPYDLILGCTSMAQLSAWQHYASHKLYLQQILQNAFYQFSSTGLCPILLAGFSAVYWFSCSFVSKACTGLGNGCERFAHRDLC